MSGHSTLNGFGPGGRRDSGLQPSGPPSRMLFGGQPSFRRSNVTNFSTPAPTSSPRWGADQPMPPSSNTITPPPAETTPLSMDGRTNRTAATSDGVVRLGGGTRGPGQVQLVRTQQAPQPQTVTQKGGISMADGKSLLVSGGNFRSCVPLTKHHVLCSFSHERSSHPPRAAT
jgi:hypothetical protein